MANDNNDKFYKGEFFKMLSKQFDDLKRVQARQYDDLCAKQDRLHKKVDLLQSKVNWIYAWAAGVGVGAVTLWNVIKTKVM